MGENKTSLSVPVIFGVKRGSVHVNKVKQVEDAADNHYYDIPWSR